MTNYLYISIVISAVALALIRFGKGTCNANYYLSLLAIIAWFIPYSLFAELIPQTVLVEPIIVAFSQLSPAAIINNEQQSYFDINFWLNNTLLILVSIGILIFIKRVTESVKWSRKIFNDPSLTFLNCLSSNHQIPIFSSNKTSSGLLLGIFNPVIIISKHIDNSKHIALIIAHEQHSVHNDNL